MDTLHKLLFTCLHFHKFSIQIRTNPENKLYVYLLHYHSRDGFKVSLEYFGTSKFSRKFYFEYYYDCFYVGSLYTDLFSRAIFIWYVEFYSLFNHFNFCYGIRLCSRKATEVCILFSLDFRQKGNLAY